MKPNYQQMLDDVIKNSWKCRAHYGKMCVECFMINGSEWARITGDQNLSLLYKLAELDIIELEYVNPELGDTEIGFNLIKKGT